MTVFSADLGWSGCAGFAQTDYLPRMSGDNRKTHRLTGVQLNKRSRSADTTPYGL